MKKIIRGLLVGLFAALVVVNAVYAYDLYIYKNVKSGELGNNVLFGYEASDGVEVHEGSTDDAGHLRPVSDNTYDVGSSALQWRSGYFGTDLTVAGTITGNLTGAVTGNADTATALASNPTDCAANQFANTIAANGNLTCSAIANADLSAITLFITAATTTLDGVIIGDSTSASSTFTDVTITGNLTATIPAGTYSVSDFYVIDTFDVGDGSTATATLRYNSLALLSGSASSTLTPTTLSINDTTSDGVGVFYIDASGNVSASGTFTGDGSGLTGIIAEAGDFATSSADYWFDNTAGITGNTNIVTVGTLSTAGGNISLWTDDIGYSNHIFASSSYIHSATTTLDSVIIGDSTSASSTFTDITITGNLTGNALKGALTGNADTATALAADPGDCGANQFANAIASSGALTCAAIADADLGAITLYIPASTSTWDGGTIGLSTVVTSGDFTAIGSVTPGSGVFTTLNATGNVDIGDAITDTLTISSVIDGALFASSTLQVGGLITTYNGLVVKSSDADLVGKFYVDTSGNVRASGTLELVSDTDTGPTSTIYYSSSTLGKGSVFIRFPNNMCIGQNNATTTPNLVETNCEAFESF